MAVLSVQICLLVGMNVLLLLLASEASADPRFFHPPSFLLVKRPWLSYNAAAADLPVPFLDVSRGGSLDASGDSDEYNDEQSDLDDPIDDVLAAEDNGEDDEDAQPTETSESLQDSPVSKESAATEVENLDDPTLDDEHSSANIDRMDYADAYDEDVEGDGGTTEGTAIQQEIVSKEPESSVAVTDTAKNPVDEIVASSEPDGESGKIRLVSTITPAMKEILMKKLKYRSHEVKVMRPEIAAVVVAKELQRPQEGLPAHWVTTEKASAGSRVKSIVLSFLTVVVAVVGGTALSGGGSDFVWIPGSSESKSAPETLYKPPPIPDPDVVPEPEPNPETKTDSEADPKPLLTPTEHEHSLRPGERPPDEPIDETGLDKMLTQIEKTLGKVFR